MKRRWKQPLALLLALSMAFCLLCGSACATETDLPEDPAQTMGVMGSGTCGDNLTWTLDDAGTLTISGKGEMWNYLDLKGYRSPWRGYENEAIKKVVIKSGVTSIGDQAFPFRASLTSVSIPDSVTSIGYCAFRACSSLNSVKIPASVTSIDGDAFSGTPWLTNQGEFAIVNGILLAYQGTEDTVTIPNTVTKISGDAFEYNSNVTSVTIPNSVTEIGDRVFYGCSNLMNVTIPNSVNSMGVSVFYDCSSLSSVTIPNKVTCIDDSTFYGCSSLTSVTIPGSVTRIGRNAFENCSSLPGITIPNSVTDIDVYAFRSCSSLTGVTLPNRLTTISGAMFMYCNSLTSVTIPDSVTSIINSAFADCDGLTTITIPRNVTRIADRAFANCDNLTSIYFSGNAPDCADATYLFWNVTATAYYPIGNKTWTSDVKQNYAGNITWKTWNAPAPPEKADQTITAKNATKTLGDKPFKLGAKTNGDGSLTYKSSDSKVATINSSGKVTLTGVGKATIAITAAATDNYKKATKKVTITVKKPTVKVPAISKPTNVKRKKMTVKWKKVSGVTGYEVQYSTDKKFKKGVKKVTVKKGATTSTTIKKLTKKKTYYVKVRAYLTIGKSTFHSKWSGVKSVKITK